MYLCIGLPLEAQRHRFLRSTHVHTVHQRLCGLGSGLHRWLGRQRSGRRLLGKALRDAMANVCVSGLCAGGCIGCAVSAVLFEPLAQVGQKPVGEPLRQPQHHGLAAGVFTGQADAVFALAVSGGESLQAGHGVRSCLYRPCTVLSPCAVFTAMGHGCMSPWACRAAQAMAWALQRGLAQLAQEEAASEKVESTLPAEPALPQRWPSLAAALAGLGLLPGDALPLAPPLALPPC